MEEGLLLDELSPAPLMGTSTRCQPSSSEKTIWTSVVEELLLFEAELELEEEEAEEEVGELGEDGEEKKELSSLEEAVEEWEEERKV